MLSLQVLHEEQQAVHHVDFAHVAVKVEREQVEFGQVALELILHTTAHDMVGDASEGLQAHHMGGTTAYGTDDLGGEQPPLAKLGVEVDDVAGLASYVEDVVEGLVVAEGSAELVCAAHLSAQALHHRGDGVAAVHAVVGVEQLAFGSERPLRGV